MKYSDAMYVKISSDTVFGRYLIIVETPPESAVTKSDEYTCVLGKGVRAF